MLEPNREIYTDDHKVEITNYLREKLERAASGRASQIDKHADAWDLDYRGIGARDRRSIPWAGASNLVVPIIQIFVDTFLARTLHILFATKPLFIVEALPVHLRNVGEKYLHLKSHNTWKMYDVCKDLIFRGAKNGTNLTKTIWTKNTRTLSSDEGQLDTITTYEGPYSRSIGFADFGFYPLEAERVEDLDLIYHIRHFTIERAKVESERQGWDVEEGIEHLVQTGKQGKDSRDGLSTDQAQMLHIYECHFKWQLGAQLVDTIAIFHKASGKLLDVHTNFFPIDPFTFYSPYPVEGRIFGDSMAQRLALFQEEISELHNSRANNRQLANSSIIKRMQGTMQPNASSAWVPNQVVSVADMNDFEAVPLGRDIGPTIPEEQFILELASRVVGLGAPQQGLASGTGGKGNTYSSVGTLALLAESNTRQNTNIKDVREALSKIGRKHFLMQAHFGPDTDLMFNHFTSKEVEQLAEVFALAREPEFQEAPFYIRSSTTDKNSEVYRSNLIQMAGILERYSTQVREMGGILINTDLTNPGLRMLYNDIVKMHTWIAEQLLKAFEMDDVEGVIPDVKAAIELAVPGGSAGSTDGGGPPQQGGGQQSPELLSRPGLQAVSEIPQVPVGPGGNGVG